MVKKAYAWKYFEETGSHSAKCTVEDCGTVIQTRGGSTSGLIKHLRTKHNLEGDNEAVENRQPPTKKQKTIPELIKFSSLNETIARNVCEYGLNFNQLSRNDYLRICMERDYAQKLPRNPTGIANHFFDYFETVQTATIQRINAMKNEGNKFSCTCDEWTACSNKRFFNINLHYIENVNKENHINLGLIPIQGSCTADNLKSMVCMCV
jgi:hypothetical protein